MSHLIAYMAPRSHRFIDQNYSSLFGKVNRKDGRNKRNFFSNGFIGQSAALFFFMLGVIKVKGLWPNRQQCSPFARAMFDTRKTRYNNCAIAQYISKRV